jgi:hypothetical protein
MNPERLDKCRLCGANGPDASGRCFDCVNAAYIRVEMEQRDQRSMFQIRDNEAFLKMLEEKK